jgi:hypothetical protein
MPARRIERLARPMNTATRGPAYGWLQDQAGNEQHQPGQHRGAGIFTPP